MPRQLVQALGARVSGVRHILSCLPPSPPSSPPLTMCGRRTSRFERVTACVGLMVGRSLSEQRVGMMRRDNVVVVAVHVQRRDGTATQCRQWRDLRVHGAHKTKSKWQCHEASVGQSLIRAAVASVARRVPRGEGGQPHISDIELSALSDGRADKRDRELQEHVGHGRELRPRRRCNVLNTKPA